MQPENLESQTSEIKSTNTIWSLRNMAIGAAGLVLIVLGGTAVIYKDELFGNKDLQTTGQSVPGKPGSSVPSGEPGNAGGTSSSSTTSLINDPNDPKVIELVKACKNGVNETVIRLIKEENVDPNVFCDLGKTSITTPLFIASESGKLDIVKSLIGLGADVNRSIPPHKYSPLHIASHLGHSEIVRELLTAGAEPNVKIAGKLTRLEGFTPLHFAAQKNLTEIIKLLIAHKAEVNALDKKGWTPLHHAIASEQLDAFDALIEGAADIGINTSDGQTVLDLAEGNDELTTKIKDLQARQN